MHESDEPCDAPSLIPDSVKVPLRDLLSSRLPSPSWISDANSGQRLVRSIMDRGGARATTADRLWLPSRSPDRPTKRRRELAEGPTPKKKQHVVHYVPSVHVGDVCNVSVCVPATIKIHDTLNIIHKCL